MNKWKTITLGDFIVLQRGHDLTEKERKKGHIPVMGAAGQNGFHNKSIAKGPGVIVGRSGGSFGKVHFSQDDYWPHNTALYVTDFKGNDERFAFYLLNLLDFSSLNSGSAQPSLNRNYLYPMKITVPELIEQKQIASVLSSLDSKIELNNRINAELDGMAKTLYDYWFVQFDFPDANGNPYKSSGGEMVWNEELKREIPEGWDVSKLENVCLKMNSGGTPSTSRQDFYNGNIPWFATNELQDDFLISSKTNISDLALEDSSAKLFPPNTILIAIYAAPTVGRLGILTKEGTFNQACCGLVANEIKLSVEYLFQVLLSMRKQFNMISSGTAQKNLSVGQIKGLNLLVPEYKINKKFSQMVKANFDKKKNNLLENQKLSELRDWLLPMLMNGQVRVK